MTILVGVYLFGLLGVLVMFWPSAKRQGAPFLPFFFWSFKWPWEVVKAIFPKDND